MAGATMWKAIDETLARPVAVLTFAPGFPRVYHVVTAARAASRMTDSRLAQVFDVEDAGERAYVVLEWVNAESLADLLAAGPLDPAHAAGLIAEAARALAGAHAAGLAHLCLTPRSLRWTPGGGVKITGLGVEAAMSGAHTDNPAVADTQGLGRLLYAGLTGHWPGYNPPWPAADTSFLPPAPVIDGELCSPRQVRAGVPTGIDMVTTQAIAGRPYRGRPPLGTPASLAEALAQVTPAAPLTPPPLPVPRTRPGQPRPGGGAQATQTLRTGDGRYGPRPPQPDRPPARRAVIVMLILAAAVAVGVAALALSHSLGKPAHAGGATTTPSHAATTVTALTPLSAHGFDVYDLSPRDGDENDKYAPLAIDFSQSSYWYTEYYLNNPMFGGLKPGTGLILDMGKQVKLSDVAITFGSTAGADVAIEVGDDNTRSPATLASFRTVASAQNIPGGTYTFHATAATGRYVLIWITRLPHEPGGPKNHYEAEILNVAVRGSS